ncbi:MULTISPECIES: hypothetical protein [unclassified Mesorhizobium]|uniref:hypothetical protein n=1 Tax=unclassified Mesorhizobium TaxID=325217 RepID=UPI0030143EB1
MELSALLPFLGHSEQNTGLSDLLATAGFDVSLMPGRAQRGGGTGHCELNSLGIELAFQFHTDYKHSFGVPKDGGKAILSAIFAYDRPGKKRQAYVGPIPFSSGPIHDRNDALREFGDPFHTEQEDGEIDWDHWMKGDVQVGAFYREDATAKYVSFAVPLKTTVEKLGLQDSSRP